VQEGGKASSSLWRAEKGAGRVVVFFRSGRWFTILKRTLSGVLSRNPSSTYQSIND
jgi:hypothetical protein